jgi:hypothetical protein
MPALLPLFLGKLLTMCSSGHTNFFVQEEEFLSRGAA